MRVLLSAYACEPNVGSEQAIAWGLAQALHGLGHDVTVLSSGSHHRAAIEAHLEAHPEDAGPRYVWHDPPRWPGPGYENARFIRAHYYAWQLTARRRVRALLREQPFDVVHHVTWNVMRWPSFLGGLGVRSVFGPVGGGQSTPPALRDGLSERGLLQERARLVLNAWPRFDPLCRWALRSMDVIVVCDDATKASLPRRDRARARVYSAIYTDGPAADTTHGGPEAASEVNADALRLLTVARLLHWKGVHLGLEAFRQLRDELPDATYTIIGRGPEAARLEQQAHDLGVAEAVRFVERVPHDEMSSWYRSADVFVFPSFHDSGGQAIGEALVEGVPVVCLDLGGPGIAIDDSCGIVVTAAGRTATGVAHEMATAMRSLARDPERRRGLAEGARRRATELTFEAHASRMVSDLYRD